MNAEQLEKQKRQKQLQKQRRREDRLCAKQAAKVLQQQQQAPRKKSGYSRVPLTEEELESDPEDQYASTSEEEEMDKAETKSVHVKRINPYAEQFKATPNPLPTFSSQLNNALANSAQSVNSFARSVGRENDGERKAPDDASVGKRITTSATVAKLHSSAKSFVGAAVTNANAMLGTDVLFGLTTVDDRNVPTDVDYSSVCKENVWLARSDYAPPVLLQELTDIDDDSLLLVASSKPEPGHVQITNGESNTVPARTAPASSPQAVLHQATFTSSSSSWGQGAALQLDGSVSAEELRALAAEEMQLPPLSDVDEEVACGQPEHKRSIYAACGLERPRRQKPKPTPEEEAAMARRFGGNVSEHS